MKPVSIEMLYKSHGMEVPPTSAVSPKPINDKTQQNIEEEKLAEQIDHNIFVDICKQEKHYDEDDDNIDKEKIMDTLQRSFVLD